MKLPRLQPPAAMNRRNALGLLLGGAGAAMLDAFCIEPDWMEVTHATIDCPRLPNGENEGEMAD